MTAPPATGPRRPLRSTVAILLGFLTVVVPSIVTDQILHALKVYPPQGEPMWSPALNLLALAYRCVYAVLGSFAAARLAPHHPMRHAMILGVVGLVLSTAGVIATANMNLGPRWYPIALAISTLPCAWLGGTLHRPGPTGARPTFNTGSS